MIKKAKKVSQFLIVTGIALSISSFNVHTTGNSKSTSTTNEQNSVLYLHELEPNKSKGKTLLHSITQEGNVIVIFYEDWCPPCKRMTPIFEEVATTLQDITFIKIKRELYRPIFDEYNLKTVPAILFFRNGKLIKIQPSSVSKNELISLINTVYN